jgi:hypothetical protein
VISLLGGTWSNSGTTVDLKPLKSGGLFGTYDYRDGTMGTLHGVVEGNTIEYSWQHGSGDKEWGKGYWEFTEQELTGRYGYGSSNSNAGQWNLTKE